MLFVDEVIENIPAGLARIDEHQPKGWEGRINLDMLDMREYGLCVLGQLYGSYGHGRDELGIEFGDGESFGFDLNIGGPEGWALLTDAWREALKARL